MKYRKISVERADEVIEKYGKIVITGGEITHRFQCISKPWMWANFKMPKINVRETVKKEVNTAHISEVCNLTHVLENPLPEVKKVHQK